VKLYLRPCLTLALMILYCKTLLKNLKTCKALDVSPKSRLGLLQNEQ